jgi:hypothetical protein
VTLSDEEARRRGTQKTVLERRAPPTFDVLIEIVERDRLAIHPDVAAAVDALVRGYPLPPEIRYRDEKGEVHVEKDTVSPLQRGGTQGFRRSSSIEADTTPAGRPSYRGGRGSPQPASRVESTDVESAAEGVPAASAPGSSPQPVRIYPYGVARNRLMQAAKRLGVPAIVVRDIGDAQILVTLRAYYRNRQQTILDAEQSGMPIYVLRANTVNQMEQFLADLFNLATEPFQAAGMNDYTTQTQAAIEAVLNGERWVDLPPAAAAVRRLQHDMARQAQLVSHSYGKDPYRRVRIYRD